MHPHEFNIQLPDALLNDKVVAAMLAVGLSAVNIKVPNNYEALLAAEPFQSEVLAIQRLLTLPRLAAYIGPAPRCLESRAKSHL